MGMLRTRKGMIQKRLSIMHKLFNCIRIFKVSTSKVSYTITLEIYILEMVDMRKRLPTINKLLRSAKLSLRRRNKN